MVRLAWARKRSLFLALCLLLASLPASCRSEARPAPLTVGEEAYFALYVGGQVIGYNTYRVAGRARQGGRDLYTVESHTLLQVDVAGQAQVIDYRATTLLAADLTPERYELVIRRNGELPARVIAERSPRAWRLSATGGSLRRELDIPLAGATYLLDYNLYEQYAFLARALALKAGEERRVHVLAPQGFAAFTLDLSAGERLEAIDTGGSTAECLQVTVKGEQVSNMVLWVTAKGELVRLELPAQELRVERSDAGITGQVRGVPLAALLASRSAPSNVEFSEYWNVDRLRARIAVKVNEERLDPAFFSDSRQRFEGSAEQGWIRGTVETWRVRYPLSRAAAFPPEGAVDPALAVYLQPEEDVEVDDQAVVAKAKEVTAGAATTWEAARAIGEWVHRNIAYEVTASGARACLENRRGDCAPQTRLVIAMCRAAGIPARMVGGLMYSRGVFGQHYWAEVHLGAPGWVPVDATAGEFADLDATHIRLWQLGTAEEVQVEVLDYEDRGGAGALLPRRALQLRTGESYTYRFTVRGQEFGEHTWTVATAPTEGEPGHLRVHVDLDPARPGVHGSRLLLDGDLWVDDQARPVRYAASADVGGEEAAVDVRFGEQGAQAEVSAHGQRVTKDVPVPGGAYLLANNVAGCFALLYRSLALEPGQELVVPVYFAESLAGQSIHLMVAGETESLTVDGVGYECLVVEVPECGQKDYVTAEGLLVRMTVPTQGMVIDLVARSPE